MGVHAGSPGMAEWHANNAERLGLPALYSLAAHAPNFPAGLECFYEHKVMLRFRRPPD